jgi:hypothetical protein
MSGSDKSLKISSSIDTKDISKMQASLKGLSSEAAKLASSLKAVSNTYKDLSKGLTESAKGFGAFNAGMKTSLDMFKQSKSEINQMIGMVNRLGTAMRKAGGLPQMGGGSTSGTGGGGGYSYTSGGGGGTQAPAGGGGMNTAGGTMVPMPGGGYMIVPHSGGGGGGGQGGGGGPSSNNYANAMTGIAMASSVAKFMGNAALTSQQNFAAVQQATKGFGLQAMYGGDLATINAMQNYNRIEDAVGSKGSRISDAANVIGEGVAATMRDPIAGGLSLVKGVAGIGAKEAQGGYFVENAMAYKSSIEAQRDKSPLKNLMFQHLQETAGVRAALAPMTQGRGVEAIWQGVGYGMDEGETAGAIGALTKKFGAGATMGGGKGGSRGLFKLSQEMGMKGYDAGAMGQMMGTMMGGMGGLAEHRPEEAYKKLESVFQKATAAGIKDSALKQGIGEEVAKATLMGGGRLDSESVGDAMIKALTRGGREVVGGDVERMKSGMSIVGGLAGETPLIAAQMMTQLRKSGISDEFQQNYLMTASMQELVSGGGVRGETIFGSADAAKKAGRAHMGDAVSLALDQISEGSVVGQKKAELLGKYGTWQQAVRQDPKAAEQLAVLLKESGASGSLFSGDIMQIAPALRFGAETDDEKMGKKGEKSHWDPGRTFKSKHGAAKASLFEQEGIHAKEIKDTMNAIIPGMKAFSNLPTEWEGAINGINAIKGLVEAINGTTIEKTKKLEERVKEVKATFRGPGRSAAFGSGKQE